MANILRTLWLIKEANYIYLVMIKTQSCKSTNNNQAIPDEVVEFNRILQGLSKCNMEQKKRHQSKAKLLARQRIELLVDRNTPFVELSALAAYNQYDNDFPSAGIVTGIGVIQGRESVVIANDATAKGGTYVKETIKKHLRAQEIAEQNNLACVYLVDSGGVFLPDQAKVFPDKNDFGRIFYNQARMSAKGIPQISIVMGSCTAGGAYIPAMSDETIIVDKQGTIFLAGPPLVKAATGEDVTAEELGGGRLHTSESGVADHLARDDHHAIQICRDIFKTLPHPIKGRYKREKPEPNGFAPEDIYKHLPTAGGKQNDVRELIKHLTDKSELHEFKPDYGNTLVTGYAKINGFWVGILANNGILFSESAQKGAHFIQLCNNRNIPMVFLQNITGFMVGKAYEKKGIAKDGAKMVNALANSQVPFFTVIIGGSYGAGNYAMGGRSFGPRLLFTWPGSSISVMGPRQAADVLVTVKRDKANSTGAQISDEELEQLREKTQRGYQKQASPYYATSRLWDDGIIDPVHTRTLLSIGLSIAQNKSNDTASYGIFRM
ncbi:3-methylcrotonyl-CoA carboxylase beta subunit/propionyl-CoA carboxylase [Saccharicrinis carchari]|uniref:3-methylcrotonyl-CoA carboxylase beta subunit/propionyl-CoA carboxylase n=1 Tax=Saccharicrinis carchari TaxID=1168039 RepID=A0A521AGJ4_SACCC|nr:carboxyl transferase domain-containing protein [Saccharicrinis carchari]SMO33931.1 3-methylcrotonyl-CoA carboxylase beta subunit/propionyl-CoA carboxylase [Saccharicrinis carchari]